MRGLDAVDYLHAFFNEELSFALIGQFQSANDHSVTLGCIKG